MKPFKWLVAFVGNMSPKVKAGLNWGTIAGLVAALADLITPSTFSWAGPLQPLLFSLAPLVIGQVAAWIKTDPFRAAGIAAAAPAVLPTVTVPIKATVSVDPAPAAPAEAPAAAPTAPPAA